MEFPDNLKYTREHEWVRIEEEDVVVGITDYAQDQLGDIVFIELPNEGDEISKDEDFGTIESVKAVSDIYAPVSGEVVEVNDALPESPEIINDDPYGEAWMVRIHMSDPSELDELMSVDEYEEYVAAIEEEEEE